MKSLRHLAPCAWPRLARRFRRRHSPVLAGKTVPCVVPFAPGGTRHHRPPGSAKSAKALGQSVLVAHARCRRHLGCRHGREGDPPTVPPLFRGAVAHTMATSLYTKCPPISARLVPIPVLARAQTS